MKDRAPKPMTEREIRFNSMSMLGQTYVRLGEVIQNPTLTEDVRAATRDNRWRMFNRMTELDREGLYSYEKYLQDEISRANGRRRMGR